MSTVVLVGLIHSICEMYTDDCNVFGKDVDELIIFLKPNKCYLDYSEINYVGKILSAEGLKMP